MKNKLTVILLVFGIMLFLGASCGDSENGNTNDGNANDEVAEEDFDFDTLCADAGSSIHTDHGSMVCAGMDEALLGTWQLQSENVVGSDLRLEGTPPNAEGRTDTFASDGYLMEEYDTEKLEKMSVDTPDGTIEEQCSVEGYNSAKYWVTFEVDDNDKATTYLETSRDLYEGPEVACNQGPGGLGVAASTASTPLGTGATAPSCEGDFSGSPCVTYQYTISDDGQVLTLNSTNGPDVTFTFQKKS